MAVPDGWQETTLGAITTKIGSGATPRGGSSVYTESGTVFIRSQNVLDHEFSDSGLAYIDDSAASALAGVEVRTGDVLLNITGDSILRCCQAPDALLPARVSQHVSIIRPGVGVHPRFLQKYLTSSVLKDRMLSVSDGATRKAITKASLEQLQIEIPPAAVQVAIAEVLARGFHGNSTVPRVAQKERRSDLR